MEFIAINTDAQALLMSDAEEARRGAGPDARSGRGRHPEVGRKAAEEHRDEIEEVLKGADMVFVTGARAAATGTPVAPGDRGDLQVDRWLTIGVVTRPFTFEGRRRGAQAERGIEKLREAVDTLIVIPNDRLLGSPMTRPRCSRRSSSRTTCCSRCAGITD